MSTPPDPTFTHGSKAELWIGTRDAPTTLQEVSERANNTGLPLERDKADVTTFKGNFKRYVAGQLDGAMPMEGPFDSWLDEVLFELATSDVSPNFRYRPIGAGAGKPEYLGKFLVTKYEISSEASGAATYSGEMQIDGEVTRAIQA
ncbi:hypothetical protein GCM10010423_65140 [Streptomyces levis]|uniref:Phage tail protein n=1 Tax=Streptomyces levis TaxID=285566 RepID=A0ABN3P5Z3_9ACTN